MQIQDKIAKKFSLTAQDVADLEELGFDTPTKIKDADPEEIPEAILAKLSRWHSQE